MGFVTVELIKPIFCQYLAFLEVTALDILALESGCDQTLCHAVVWVKVWVILATRQRPHDRYAFSWGEFLESDGWARGDQLPPTIWNH